MTEASESLTFNQTVKGIAEFIEVAIHTILYVRQIYPPDLFVRRKKYDTPVFQSRHPALNEYISGAVKAVTDELRLGNVDKVVVVIKDKDHLALERFIFSVNNMIQVESYNKDTSVQDAMSSIALSQYFRSFLIKLTMIEAQLGLLELQDEASFAIVIELNDDKVPSARQDQDPSPWVPADRQLTTAGASDEAQLHLLRAVDTGIINLSLAVQESEDKLRRLKNLHANGDSHSKGKGKDNVA
ncbi:DNA-binding protein [Paxillus ammoniavirescens]|nr:DNA-binding protein [Paxillus ammoniavirescens]